MTDSSDDSVHTVISALDSRLSQSLSPEDKPANLSSLDCCNPTENDNMGNRFGGEKKKDNKPEKKPEDKPKKKGKKSKRRSKRNSKNVEADVQGLLEGACASPVSDVKDRPKRPDVLADLGVNSAGPSLASPTGSQCTWSYDEESDVSTLGYSTPLSTPQIRRYVMPKQQTQQQTSTERLEELGRSIEKNIIDNLSDPPPVLEGAATSATSATATTATTGASPASTAERRGRRNVKKKRVLGQAVIDSDIFTLPMQDVKGGQSSSAPPENMRLYVDNKICLRASQESPVSAWLLDDETPIDEEQMDEMFISCIDLSYNLADICSEKEFTEYGSLESRKRAKAEKSTSKETSLSPSTARRPLDIRTPPVVKREIPKLKAADSRDTPPKSDSSTSTLAEGGLDSVPEITIIGQPVSHEQHLAKPSTTAGETTKETHTDTCANIVPKADNGSEKQSQPKKKSGKSKSKSKSKKKKNKDKDSSITNSEQVHAPSEDIQFADGAPVLEESSVTGMPVQDMEDGRSISTEDVVDPTVEIITIPEHACQSMEVKDNVVNNDIESDLAILSTDTPKCLSTNGEIILSNPEACEPIGEADTKTKTNSLSKEGITQLDEKDMPVLSETIDYSMTGVSGRTTSASVGLSPPEPSSPKHVPPPSPTAMDCLLEGDEDEDEDSLEFMENNCQMKEVQLFGETVFKRLSSLVESQSQDEEDRLKDFREFDDIQAMPLELESTPLITDDDNLLPRGNIHEMCSLGPEQERKMIIDVMEENILPEYCLVIERSVIHRPVIEFDDASQIAVDGCKDDQEVDEGTLKRKKRKKIHRKHKEDDDAKNDSHGSVVKRPEIPAELKQVETMNDTTKSDDHRTEAGIFNEESKLDTILPKRESQQIKEVIDLYGFDETLIVRGDHITNTSCTGIRTSETHTESGSDYETDDSSEYSCSEHPTASGLELASCIPPIEDTFNELLSVKHILDDSEDRTPTEENIPSFVMSDGLRSPPDSVNWRRSRVSPAVTDRTESDLDVSEQRDDISTDSMYADDEDDGVSEVLFSRSYSEPAGNEVVVSCTFYNTQHNATDSDDFWEDYSTADESFKQIEISADAASATFQNARKQMQEIHIHLQDLRRQMEHLQEEVDNATLSPEYSLSSEDKRLITE